VKIKNILKSFIPPIFLYILNFLTRNKGLPPFYSTIDRHIKTSDKIIILGNGPSLKAQLTNSIDILKSNICVCVNSFVLTEYYSIIKPKVYILIDPAYFEGYAVPEVDKEIITVLDNLVSKTTWDIDLIVCSKYKNNDRVQKLISNPHINVLFINLDKYDTFYSKEKQFELFNKNKIEAPSQTVLNTAVYLSIFWRYKTIILIGADTSWHEEVRIDQETNELYYEDEHFYGLQKRISYNNPKIKIPNRLHQDFFAIARALEYYWLLREYADYNYVSVYNASEKSWIDAFERKKLTDFK